MAKLFFSENAVKNIVDKSLTSTIDNLAQAIAKNNSLSIPNGFEYQRFLSSLGESLLLIQNDLKNIQDWLYKINTIYFNRTTDLMDCIDALDNIEIIPHENIIKL